VGDDMTAMTGNTDGAQLLYAHYGRLGGMLRALLGFLDYAAAIALAVDVVVVFASVIFRYFLHDPVDWAEEVARALMVLLVFFGAGTALGRGTHAGIEVLHRQFPETWHAGMVHISRWIVAAVATALFITSCALAIESHDQTTPLGLPHGIYAYPVVFGSLCMTIFAWANAVDGTRRLVWRCFIGCALLVAAIYGWNHLLPQAALTPLLLLLIGFIVSVIVGVPIAFALAFGSLVYFLADPSLPMVIYSQQVAAGADHFVLLAIPFFVLAGIAMEVNGMSARLIGLLLRLMGRMRGGINLIIIVSTAVFSGISGSKLADIAAVSGIIMPAVRRSRQDGGDGGNHPALCQHDHFRLCRQCLGGRPVHGRPDSGRPAGPAARRCGHLVWRPGGEGASAKRRAFHDAAHRRLADRAGDDPDDRPRCHQRNRHFHRDFRLRRGLCAGGGRTGFP
jgi:TRAP-type C4-dicarboxylate transport system permease small subunit